MSKNGYRSVISAMHDLGFKGGLTAPATRQRERDFVDWLAISTAYNSGDVGAITLHVNLGVRWLPMHKLHKKALGWARTQPECLEPLYVLMPHNDMMHWVLAADDSNVEEVSEDLVKAISGEAERYWRSVSQVSRVCEDLRRRSDRNNFPDGLDWPLALLLTEGREEALVAVQLQKAQLADESKSPWLLQTREFISQVEAYLTSNGGKQ